MVGGDPLTDEALAAALEELIINSKSDFKLVALFSFNAPMTNHEPCLGDYVSPQLEELREMGVSVMNIGINLDAATIENLQCMVPAGEEDAADDYLVNTDSLDTLAEEMGFTECSYDDEQGYEYLSGDDGEHEFKAQDIGICTSAFQCLWGIC